MKKFRKPKLRLHKPSGQGFIEVKGWLRYVGRWDPERPDDYPITQENYEAAVKEVRVNGGRLPDRGADTRVVEVVTAFLDHAKTYYRGPDGNPTTAVANFRIALNPLRELYGNLPAAQFGPLNLRAVRERQSWPGWSGSITTTIPGLTDSLTGNFSATSAPVTWSTFTLAIPPTSSAGTAWFKLVTVSAGFGLDAFIMVMRTP